MRKLYLSGKNTDKYVLLDDDDYERLKDYKYYLMQVTKHQIYIARNEKYYIDNVKRKYSKLDKIAKFRVRYIHHDVAGKPKSPFVIDHIDGNPFNNQKENLRIVNQSTNTRNRNLKPNRNNTSGYLGIYNTRGKWRSHIKQNYKDYYLGTYDTAEEAHIAYRVALALIERGIELE